MMDKGFIVIWRKMITSWVWCLNDADFRLAVTCVCMANWQEGRWFDGKETLKVERGSFVTTVAKLTSELGKESSPKKVRNGLRRLEAAEFLKTGNGAGKRYTLISILNYDEYQKKPEEPGKTSGTDRATTGQRPGTDRATIEQVNKGTKEQGKKVVARKRAHQIPDSWQPTEKHTTLAAELCVDMTAEAEKFRDYWLGEGKAKTNWNATFNNWLRNAKTFADRRVGSKPDDIRVGHVRITGKEKYCGGTVKDF